MKATGHHTLYQPIKLMVYSFLLLVTCRAVIAQGNEEEFLQSSQVIVMVVADYEGIPEYGAGIIIGREKKNFLIATAYHIVHRGTIQPNSIKVRFRALPDKWVEATLAKQYSEEIDLTMLIVEDPSHLGKTICPPMDRLGKVSDLKRGSEVFSVGNPNGVSWAVPVDADKVSQMVGNEIVFQSDFIRQGHSGGALIDADGNIVGMTTKDEPPFGKAINIETILNQIKQWGYPVQLDVVRVSGRTPLHEATEKGDLPTIKTLLAACTNPNARNERFVTPLHVAAGQGNVEAMSLLLEAGANLYAYDKDGDSPLLWAIKKRQLESFKFLVKKGVNINVKSKSGNTALNEAIKIRQPGFVKLLVEAGVDVNAKDSDYWGPLYLAAKSGDLEIIDLLVKAGAKEEARSLYSPISEWVQKGEMEVVKSLLKIVEDDREFDEWKGMLLKMEVYTGRIEMIKLFVMAGADVNFQAANSMTLPAYPTTPLYDAIYTEKLDIADYLLSKGGIIKGDSTTMENIIYLVLLREKGWDKYVDLLIQAGAQPTTNELNFAIEKNKIGLVKKFLQVRSYNSFDVGDEKTPLQTAAEEGRAEIIKVLIEAGAKVDEVSSSENRRPLELSIYHQQVEATKALLQAGADPNLVGVQGRPMDIAIDRSDLEIVRILIKAGADINAKSERNQTPLKAALNSNRKDIADLLRASGAKEE